MHKGFIKEIKGQVAILLGSLLLGWIWGQPLPGLLLGFVLVIGYYLWQLARLLRWMQQPEDELPEAAGLWGAVFDHLARQRRTSKGSEVQLRELLTRIRRSSQSLHDGVVMMGGEGEVQWWNQSAEKLIGLQAPADLGNPITLLLRMPDFIEYFETGDYQEPLVLPSPLHQGRTLEYQISRFAEDGYLMLIRDFTRIQRLEQMRQDFIANVSHELRTPLTVITGYLETFMDHAQDLPPKWQRGLQLMQQQSDRMSHLVEDLLMLSQLETSDFEPASEPLDIHQLINSILTDARVLSVNRHQLVVDVDASLRLLGCEKELRSAFSNLVFNAVKYTPEGTRITLRWYCDAQGACFQVEDNGPGIEMRHLARLTERFYRVDQGRASSTGGTGLGLAIVKHVMLRHQGTLDIASEPGVGSRFTCRFPRSLVEQPGATAD